MLDRDFRTQAWLEDLKAIITEIDAGRLPAPRQPARARDRRLRPLWEE